MERKDKKGNNRESNGAYASNISFERRNAVQCTGRSARQTREQ